MINPKKFRKKPVVIEAIQWTGDNYDSVCDFLGDELIMEYSKAPSRFRILVIETLEGTVRASSGDWIIKGVKNEFYPCRKDIFESTYDEVK